MRPAAFIVELCNNFPHTEFRLLRETKADDTAKVEAQRQGIMKRMRGFFAVDEATAVDPKRIMDLVCGQFIDGEEVILEVTGKCEIMAAEFFKIAWENLGDYSDDIETAKARLTRLIDEAFSKIEDPDIEGLGGKIGVGSEDAGMVEEEESRSVAIINDRLHDLTLPMIPAIMRYFGCRLKVAFEVPEDGIFSFEIEPNASAGRDMRILQRILELPVEVGTRITVLTAGQCRFKANQAVRSVLRNLWQCDAWLRDRGRGFDSEETVVQLLEFATKVDADQSREYSSVQNPYISNLLFTSQHVIINPSSSQFSKEEALSQLAAPHAHLHHLELSWILNRVHEAEQKQPVVLRDGFAIAHGAVDRNPRISITFGVYPAGVVWDYTGRRVKLVAMVVFAKDAYGTWRDYLKKLAIVFRTDPGLQEQLVTSENSDEFRGLLRRAETEMIK